MPIPLDERKKDKIVDAYLQLAETIQKVGGDISFLRERKDIPMQEFMEEICATNNIRFKQDKE